ncbi:MAG: DUF1592 domain-containing protein [Myxococcaceae bacterium]
MSAHLSPSRLGVLLVSSALLLPGCYGQSLFQSASEDGPVIGPDGRKLPPFEPAPLAIRQLLGWQYRNAVRDLLGIEAANAVTPPADSAVNGFESIGAAQLSLSSQAVEQYERSATSAAELAFTDATLRGKLVPCAPGSNDDAACMRTVIDTFGRRAWRRPLNEDELSTWVNVGLQTSATYGDFYKGAQFAIAGLLQSPNFLYIVEVGEPDPARPERVRLTGTELATRLAFFLTGTIPDEALLAAAESGALDTTAGIRAEAERHVQKPEARDALRRFFDEAFRLRTVDSMVKHQETFPEFTPALAKAMHEEANLLLDDVIWERDADFREVLDATHTFVNADLAKLYGLPDVPTPGFSRVELDPNGVRGGFLGQAAFLSLMAHQRTTSPTNRGRFVRERLLCEPVAAPPPGVTTNLVEEPGTGGEKKTQREKLWEHRANPACAACHVAMDPVGLGLENFDALGRYQENDNGKPVDAVSEFDDRGRFQGALELGRLLRDDVRVVECLVKNVHRMATGHVELESEAAPLWRAQQAFASNGHRMKALLVEIVASDAFRYGKREVQP